MERDRGQQSLPATVDEQAGRDRANHWLSGILRAEKVHQRAIMLSRGPSKRKINGNKCYTTNGVPRSSLLGSGDTYTPIIDEVGRRLFTCSKAP